MKTNHFKVLVTIISSLFILCSCEKKWTLETMDTRIVIGVDNNSSPCIYELSNRAYKWNWTSTPSVLQLPAKVVVRDGETFNAVSWTFDEVNKDNSNGKTITMTFACKQVPGLSLQSVWWASSSSASGPVQHTWKIRNNTASVVSLYPQLEGLDLSVKTDKPTELWYVSKDGGPKTDSIGVRKEQVSNGKEYNIPLLDGSSQHGFVPLAILNSSGKHGLYVGWEWQTGRLNVSTTNGFTRIRAGYANGGDVPAEYLSVAAGTTFDVPSTYLGVYNGTVDDGTNGLKRWFWVNKVPSNMRKDTTEPWIQYGSMFQYATGWGANEEVYKRGMTEKLSGIPFEVVEIDYGWWGPASESRGFEAYKPWWPNSMSVGGKLAHENGFRFNLYFCGMVDWRTKEMLKAKWDQYGMDCWRDDFGRTPLSVLDWLSENIPNYRYENCSGGAQWKDYATLRRASVQTITDNVFSALAVRQAFYDASYAIPAAQLSQALEWRNAHDEEYIAWLRSGMQGAIWWGMHTGQKDIVLPSDRPFVIQPMKDLLSLYKTKLRPLIREANIYHILPRPDGVHWDGIEYYDPNNLTGAVMLFKPDSLPDTKTVQFAGLDSKKDYILTFTDRPEQNATHSGTQLMEQGLPVTIKGKNQSEIIFFQSR